jgi:hypothetical protein
MDMSLFIFILMYLFMYMFTNNMFTCMMIMFMFMAAPGDREPLIGGARWLSTGELRLGRSVTWSFCGWTYRQCTPMFMSMSMSVSPFGACKTKDGRQFKTVGANFYPFNGPNQREKVAF